MIADQINELIAIGQWIQANNWCPATSGNLSTRELGCGVEGFQFHISVSGKYKGELSAQDFILVDEQGLPLDSDKKPSAETQLHSLIYKRFADAKFVLHTHSVYGTVLGQYTGQGSLVLHDYELQKAFKGVASHEGQFSIPVFSNSQDMVALAEEIDGHFQEAEAIHAFLLAGHGLYTWGGSDAEAKRHLEALEFLFECEYKLRLLRGTHR